MREARIDTRRMYLRCANFERARFFFFSNNIFQTRAIRVWRILLLKCNESCPPLLSFIGKRTYNSARPTFPAIDSLTVNQDIRVYMYLLICTNREKNFSIIFINLYVYNVSMDRKFSIGFVRRISGIELHTVLNYIIRDLLFIFLRSIKLAVFTYSCQ